MPWCHGRACQAAQHVVFGRCRHARRLVGCAPLHRQRNAWCRWQPHAPAGRPAGGRLHPLTHACMHGPARAWPCLQNERGISPLGVAVGFNKPDMVRWLLAKGADVHFTDAAGNCLMHYAAGELAGWRSRGSAPSCAIIISSAVHAMQQMAAVGL